MNKLIIVTFFSHDFISIAFHIFCIYYVEGVNKFPKQHGKRIYAETSHSW